MSRFLRAWPALTFVGVAGLAGASLLSGARSGTVSRDVASKTGCRREKSAGGREKSAATKNFSHERKLKEQDIALSAGLRGKLRRIKLAPSPLLSGRALAAWVYLPPDYEKSLTRLPVAYVMHGNPGGVRESFVNASVHRVTEQLILGRQIAPMILVGWEGSGPRGFADPVFYLDRRDGKYQMETWMLRELVPWVDTHFRTLPKPQARALVGFSAGGFGATNLGLKHPGVFRVMASHAGFFDPDDDPKVMTSILGPRSTLWKKNSPIELARQIPVGERLHFYMDCGRGDSLLPEWRKMEAELRARNVDFEAHVFAGAHNWKFLHAHYFDSLRFCDARFQEMGVSPKRNTPR